MSETTTEETKSAKDIVDQWQKELSSAKKWFRKFHKAGERANKAFLDSNRSNEDEVYMNVTRLNLYHSNIITLMSMLYGRIPKVDVSRRFADSDDDVARVAGEILTRILNTDIEVAGEDIASVFRSCLQDRLIPGLGSARLQYKYRSAKHSKQAITDEKTGAELAPAVDKETIQEEWTDIVYTFWQDVLWSPARTYPEIRWKAYRSYLTKKKFKQRFKDADLSKVQFSSKNVVSRMESSRNEDNIEENAEAEVWEIWDKEEMCVLWYTQGYPKILEKQEDPLELEGFWPDPPPLISNFTTTKYLPKADYDLAKDLYQEVDELETRISLLTEACKCVGVYDSSNEGVQRIFNEAVENQLIPVKNWGQFSEKGGLKGTIEWVPLEDVVNTIKILTEKQNDKIQQLMQVTGMSDVMRGAAMQEGTPVSATERKIQANYGSIRIEALQNEFARWVSDTQALKAEIISKHYQAYCIIEQSNIMSTEDGKDEELIQAAVALIKDPSKSRWKISVRPETLAIADYAQLKADRVEFLMGVAQFMQSCAPLIEQAPAAGPYLMKMLQWGMAGFRGSSEIEGVLDQAITQMEKSPPQQKQDPAAQKAQVDAQKAQSEMEQSREEHQANMAMQQQKFQGEMQENQQKFQLEMSKMQMEIQQMRQEFQLHMKELMMQLGFKVKEKQVEAEANQQEQATQFAYNTAEREHEAAVQVQSGNEELRRDRARAKIKPSSNDNA